MGLTLMMMTMSGRKPKKSYGGAMAMDDEYQNRKYLTEVDGADGAPEESVCYNPTELRLIGLLERARTILGNMAEEREGFLNSLLGRRWPISHEPLRSDARNLLPEIDKEILRR